MRVPLEVIGETILLIRWPNQQCHSAEGYWLGRSVFEMTYNVLNGMLNPTVTYQIISYIMSYICYWTLCTCA